MLKNLRLFLIFNLLLLAVSSCSAGGISEGQDNYKNNMTDNYQLNLPRPIKEFVDAVNKGDEAAFLSFFDKESGVIDDWGRILTGHQQIKAWSDKEFIGAKGIITPTKIETNDNKISLWAGWKSEYYSGDSKFIFTVEGEKIKEMKIVSAK